MDGLGGGRSLRDKGPEEDYDTSLDALAGTLTLDADRAFLPAPPG